MPPHSPTDLAGLRVSSEDYLAAVLETAAQPIWVVDPAGVIRFANPAAVSALGYDGAEELLGRRSHETIHYKGWGRAVAGSNPVSTTRLSNLRGTYS